MLTVGSLFSGIGGFDLGLERAGMRSVWQCEIDPYCQRVLAKHWPDVLRVPDIRDVEARTVPAVDVIAGGFPCQDLSYAGRGAGIDGERSGLWSEYARVVGELRPRYVVVENVSALLARGLDRVLADLAALGYDAEWDCIPASAVGAPHQRDRLWLVAYPSGQRGAVGREAGHLACAPRAGEGEGHQRQRHGDAVDYRGSDMPDTHSEGRGELAEHDSRSNLVGRCASGRHADGLRDEVADADSGGRDGRPGQHRTGGGRELADGGCEPASARTSLGWWAVEPDVGRVAHGVPARVDRLRALGNALVPQIAEWIGRRILDYEVQEGRLAGMTLHATDENVEEVHKIVNGWAMLTSRDQIRCVLAAAAQVEREMAKQAKEANDAA